MNTPLQRTLKHPVHCYGKGVHSGLPASLSLHPAPEDTGIVFIRSDILHADREVKADFRNVTTTMLGTTIANFDKVSVSTIEHLMAALWGCAIDNAYIEIDGPEVPIMDGSSEPFVFLIECAGSVEQKKPRQIIEVLKPVSVRDGEASISIAPSTTLEITLEIQYENPLIATQRTYYDAIKQNFQTDLCRARTFGLMEEVDMLRAKGLAKGGSLENAIVVDGDTILNEGGLRYPNEFVKHKILDCIGDIYLAGHIHGAIEGTCSGHRVNNMLLHALFAHPDAWRYLPIRASHSASSAA